ncbi:MAG: 30S ribosomal protein S12 methylthiotransferase RimO [Deferribacteraceae bacterium]|nr:30S ribosomal protein S12 methylthiotransferase RimO [Deferribacteraceae bacterium]
MKIGLISLGCAKNQVDLERLVGKLSHRLSYNKRKFEFSDDTSACDLLLVNTCGFIRPAVEEAIDAILSAKQELPAHAKLVVLGCMAERYADSIAEELPEIDFVAGVDQQDAVLTYIDNLYKLKDAASTWQGERHLLTPPHYAYLKISEGCNNRCAYCTIPSIRGAHTSVPIEKLISETQQLVAAGAKEIIIISQDSTKYGQDLGEANLASLLRQLAPAFPAVYFRVMYLNPDGVTEELIDTIASMSNIMRYFDIPIQHASDSVLKRMNRHSRKADIEQVFAMIRKKLPEAFIRTTAIVGFPGETEADFAELEQLLQLIMPDYAGFFPYSPEDDTPAAKMTPIVDNKIVQARLKALQKIQKNNTLLRLKQMKKTTIGCFVDKINDDFDFILEGRAFFQAPEVDGKLYVTDGIPADGSGPYKAKIVKIVYPDIYVKLLGSLEII